MKTINWKDYISIDPEICHGKPCFKGTRIMVATVLELMESGRTYKQIKKGYPSLTARHVQAALHFAHCLMENGPFQNMRGFQHAFAH